ncbi:MAG: ABC transporter permease [Clostridia bacterium]|nr:ABC transporter permease [Clostridia bacterium]
MYIIKNALRCISRSKGRNILIGIIVLVIAVSACIGLSIRQAAESAREDTLSTLSVTGTISFDRQSMMSQMVKPEEGKEPGSFDREQFSKLMGSTSSLTLEEYQKYAEAESVQDFYYTASLSLNGTENFAAVTSDTEEEAQSFSNMFGGKGGMADRFNMASADFSIVGYSSETAMTEFQEGNASITDGAVFEEGTAEAQCIITEELATFNNLSVGDTVQVANPADETEVYTLTVVGLYTDSSDESGFSGMGMNREDPANKIYMSYNALKAITDTSAAIEDNENVLSASLSSTYVFATAEDFEAFEAEARALGLSDSYTVSSADLTAYENSLTPLNTLSTMAGWFLLVILLIGAVILIVLNIFSVRERKYEIGVLTAMGMKKGKVALQFLTEIFAVTIVAVMLGAVIGGVTSVPVTNALLENQITSSQSRSDRVEQSFGRGGGGGMGQNMPAELPTGNSNSFKNMMGQANNYITEVNAAMNLTVVLQLLGIAVLLTLVAGMFSMLFVMRYEPLKILANRD